MHWLLETRPSKIYKAFTQKVIPNIGNIKNSKLRTCRCCQRKSIFVQYAPLDELIICIHCRANLRYEMIAEYIRESYNKLDQMEVLELDRASPLRVMLSQAKRYTRSFYDPSVTRGAISSDGAQMEDATNFTFPDRSFDLVVSSDVFEHIPDLEGAFAEVQRVLKPGGAHIFSVPSHEKTKKLAEIVGGEIHHIVVPPEYHGDNNASGGILAFWHIGPDLTNFIDLKGVRLVTVKGPEGNGNRVVWKADHPDRLEV